MNGFTLLFLTLLAVSTALQLWLAARHIRHVRAHRGHVPDAFHGVVPEQAHAKAADYTVIKTHLTRIDLVVDVALLLALTLGGGLQALDTYWRAHQWSTLVTGAAFLLSLLALLVLKDLPLQLYRTFAIEARFGFNRTTPRLFLVDLAKSIALGLLIGGPLLLAILWLMQRMGAWWWLYVWLIWNGFTLTLAWAYPVLIAPLFNRFRPLEDGPLMQRVLGLLERTGFRAAGVFVMDGSRRSAHGNAYFTGLGRHKRIVFFDTLLKGLEPAEIEAVLAHELGHFKLHHVRKRLAAGVALNFVALALLGVLAKAPWFYHGLGVRAPSMYMALALFLLAAPVFTFVLRPLFAWTSRRHEYEADRFAAAQSDGPTLARALVKLYEENAATLTPDPLHSAFYDSHPPAPARIARLREATG